jgi:ferritin-like metal-binding protein YciE
MTAMVNQTKSKGIHMSTLKDLYIDELKDLLHAEKQLVKALPKMAKATTSPDLKAAFEEHLQETEGHVNRLEQVFKGLNLKPETKACKAMQGLVEEGGEMIEEDEFEGAVKDAGLIGAAKRVEHYEMAAYGATIAFAREIGDDSGAKLLQQNLEEEEAADKTLTELSSNINAEANQGNEDAGEDENEEKPSSKPRKAA